MLQCRIRVRRARVTYFSMNNNGKQPAKKNTVRCGLPVCVCVHAWGVVHTYVYPACWRTKNTYTPTAHSKGLPDLERTTGSMTRSQSFSFEILSPPSTCRLWICEIVGTRLQEPQGSQESGREELQLVESACFALKARMFDFDVRHGQLQ